MNTLYQSIVTNREQKFLFLIKGDKVIAREIVDSQGKKRIFVWLRILLDYLCGYKTNFRAIATFASDHFSALDRAQQRQFADTIIPKIQKYNANKKTMRGKRRPIEEEIVNLFMTATKQPPIPDRPSPQTDSHEQRTSDSDIPPPPPQNRQDRQQTPVLPIPPPPPQAQPYQKRTPDSDIPPPNPKAQPSLDKVSSSQKPSSQQRSAYKSYYNKHISDFWPFIDKAADEPTMKQHGLSIMMGNYPDAHDLDMLTERLKFGRALLPTLSTEREQALFARGLFCIAQALSDRLRFTPDDPLVDASLKEKILSLRTIDECSEWIDKLSALIAPAKKTRETPIGKLSKKSIKKLDKTLDLEDKSLGTAIDNGDCFYDSFAQSYSFLTGNHCTIKDLRLIVHNYLRNIKDDPDHWASQYIKSDKLIADLAKKPINYTELVQYTGEELVSMLSSPLPVETSRSPVETSRSKDPQPKEMILTPLYGDPHLEGKILSEHFKVALKLYEFEFYLNEDTNQYRENDMTETHLADSLKNARDIPTVEIARYGTHYVPVIAPE